MATIYYTAMSLDGFLADAHNSLDWLFQFKTETNTYAPFIANVGALAMGATTYRWLLDYQVQAGEPTAWPYSMPTWVFTHRRFGVPEGADIRFVQGAVQPVHDQMLEAAGGRDVWVVGGGELAGQFYDSGRLNGLILTIASTTLGAGAPLFPRRTAPPLRLNSVTQFGADFAELRYDVIYA